MKPVFPLTLLRKCALAWIATALALGSQAALGVSTIEPLHWYRMGDALEIDPAVQPMIAPNTAAPTLHDSLNGAELQAIGPAGTITSRFVPSESSVGFLTQRGLEMPSTGGGYTGEVLTTGTDDFQFEGWLTLFLGQPLGSMCVACNGTPGVDGWSIYLERTSFSTPGKFVVRYGSTVVASLTTPVLSSTPVPFALIHSHVRGEYILLGSNLTLFKPVTFTPPTGHFTLGACPDGAGGYKDLYNQSLDEIRFSRLLQFDPAGAWPPLLYRAPDIQVISSPGKSFYHSGEVDLGSVGTGGRRSLSIYAQKALMYSVASIPVIGGITMEGPDAAEFKLTNYTPFPSSFSTASLLEFLPTTPGEKTVTVTVASDDPDDSLLKITYHATVFAAPDIAVFTGPDPATGTPVDSGSGQILPAAAPGVTGAETLFSIRNTGLVDMHLSPASVKGNDQGAFVVSRQPEATLAPGASTVVGVRFRPVAGGARQAYVLLSSDAANSPNFLLSVAATAPGPVLQVSGPDGAVLASREVRAWGQNGTELDVTPPGLGAVKSIASGSGFAAAVRMDGSVVQWGAGSGSLAAPAGLTGVTQLVTAGTGLLALKSDGTVTAWAYGNAPVNVPAGLSGVTALAASSGFALALKSDGTVTGWSTYTTDTVHQIPADLAGVKAISAGDGHAIALKNDGTIVDWGRSTVVPPAGLNQVVAIEATEDGGLALRADGSIVSWKLKVAGGSPFPDNGSPIVALGKGDEGATAIRADGTVALAGGTNSYGELVEPVFPHHALDIQTDTSDVLELYDSRVDLSAGDPQHTGIAQTITIANGGATDLHLNGTALGGPGADGYLLDSSEMAAVLEPGATTSLTVALVPGSDGAQEATLEIASDDPGHPAFSVRLAGKAQVASGPYDLWKSAFFPTGGAGAGDLTDPNGNGIPNLIEYALGGDPVAVQSGSTSVLPQFTADGSGGFTYTFTFDQTKIDLVLTLQGSDTLAADGWTDLARSTAGSVPGALVPGLTSSPVSSSGSRQKYRFSVSTSVPLTAPHRFLRLKVSTR